MLIASSGPPAAVAATWQSMGLGSADVYQLIVDESAPGTIYAATRGDGHSRSGLLKTTDGGRGWVPLERGLPSRFQPTAIAASPDAGRIVLLAGVDGLFRSTVAGAMWSAVRVPLPPITAIAFDRSNPQLVLAGSELRGNFRSTDGGRTWRPANVGLPRDRYGNTAGAVALVQDSAEPRVFYMGTNGFDGVYRSNDGGLTWTAAGTGLPSASTLAVGVNAASPGAVFALSEQGLATSTDGGASWQLLSGLPPVEPVAMAFEPGGKDTMYVAGARGALLRSTDGGKTWVDMPALPRPVRALAAWFGTTGAVLAAAAGEGVWRIDVTPTLPASPLPVVRDRFGQPTSVYYRETGHNISPAFYPSFRALGGLERFGYPRTEEFMENGLLVQYFQRARLEYHPEWRGTAYEVQLSLVAEWLLDGQPQSDVEPFESSAEQRYFTETGHSVSYAFLRYFETRAGLDSLGYPISEELLESGRPVQYFQRARLEYRAEYQGTRDEVQLGLIGDEILRRRAWLD
ncbi:MAG: hypothetical protein HY332_06830 [Chloroflexi bacterium]|nr:hypothetical protein [Chloroflexota bacterium]